MDFRAKVAMFGHMGVEADPARMTDKERSTLAAHIALYKQWRGVLHSGAAAFAAMWRAIPLLRPLGLLARLPIFATLFERAYLAFLKVRPQLQRLLA